MFAIWQKVFKKGKKVYRRKGRHTLKKCNDVIQFQLVVNKKLTSFEKFFYKYV